jgi:hypothetical protein
MKTNGKSRLVILCVVVVLLFAVLAVGIGIKLSKPNRPEVESQAKQQQTKSAQTHPQKEESTKPSEMTAEDEEFLLWLDDKIEKLEEEEAAAETMLAEEEPEDIPEAEPVKEEAQETRSFGGWREVWADLNLTEEEQARMREGFRLAIERWQNMSPQEREDETARLREMGERWENMSDEERQETSERMRDRFEEWRQSGDVELPQLTLD